MLQGSRAQERKNVGFLIAYLEFMQKKLVAMCHMFEGLYAPGSYPLTDAALKRNLINTKPLYSCTLINRS